MISQTHMAISTQTHSWTHTDTHKHMPNLRYQYICKDQVCLHIDTQTQTAPPRKTATPATTIKASFTAQGVMGTVAQLGGGRRPPRRAVPALPWLPLSLGERTLSFFQHAPLCSPRAVTLLSPEIRPHPLPTTRAPEDLWLAGGT